MSADILATISGVDMTPFSRQSADSFSALGQRAVLGAIEDAGLEVKDIDEFVCGTGYGGPLSGQRIAGPIGLSGPRITNVENACSSGLAALAVAVDAVRVGRAKHVVVLGIDKLSDLGKGALPLSQEDVEVRQGVVMPAVYAMRARRYLYETDATIADLAAVSQKSRRNGAGNPRAQMRDEVTIDEVLKSRPVADPLTLFMCCPSGDGAAAVVVSAVSTSPKTGSIGLKALEVQSGRFTDGHRDMTRSELSERAIGAAYSAANLGPKDMQVAETHDAFAIAEIMYYEALGFADPGQGWRLIREHVTERDGKVAVNPGGGLLSRGHPVGATGIAQICESYWQLTGEAGDLQVDGARNAITHVTGGGIAGFDHGAAGVAILGRV